MLSHALNILKSSLNSHFKMANPHTDSLDEKVVFPPGINTDYTSLPINKVSLLLARLEEEKALRAPDLYQSIQVDGSNQTAAPEIRLNLFVVFAANYNNYEDSLRNISFIINYFQNHRLITHDTTPDLHESLQQLVIELVTLSFAEQNELWASLRMSSCPFVLYKIKMVVFKAETSATVPVGELVIEGLE